MDLDSRPEVFIPAAIREERIPRQKRPLSPPLKISALNTNQISQQVEEDHRICGRSLPWRLLNQIPGLHTALDSGPGNLHFHSILVAVMAGV